jgi:hypothetical protein
MTQHAVEVTQEDKKVSELKAKFQTGVCVLEKVSEIRQKLEAALPNKGRQLTAEEMPILQRKNDVLYSTMKVGSLACPEGCGEELASQIMAFSERLISHGLMREFEESIGSSVREFTAVSNDIANMEKDLAQLERIKWLLSEYVALLDELINNDY